VGGASRGRCVARVLRHANLMGNFIPERVLEEIRFRNDIVEVIGSHITLKRAGTTYKACCPFHKEKTPSFNVNPNLQIFKCFGCGEGGDVISFLMKHQGLDFITAAKVLAERAGISLELEADSGASKHRKLIFEINHAISQFYRRCLVQAPAAKAAREYLADRGLDGDIAESFLIGYAPDGWDVALQWGAKYNYSPDQLEAAGLVLRSTREGAQGRFYDRFRDRLMFPILDSQGRVIGFSGRILVKDDKSPKYVNSPETEVFHKGRVLYGMDKARRHIVNAPNREAIICEGQIDVVRCHDAGVETAVAAQGTAFTEEHVRALKNYADSVVLAFDSDNAGKAAAVKTAVVFMDAGIVVRVAELPDGEDPDSYVKANGGKAFRDLLAGAQSAVAFQIKSLSGIEQDANGVAATSRIAKAVLNTISHSANAVQKARLLQEAATLLSLPVSALEEDLGKVVEEQKRVAERHASRPKRKASKSAPAVVVEHEPAFIEEGEIEIPQDVLDASPFAGGSGASGTVPAAAPPPVRVPDDEQALCELIIHVVDHPELATLIAEFLPLDMISNLMCRHLVSCALDAASHNNDLLEELLAEGETSAHVLAYAEALLSAPVKVSGREYSPAEAVQDLILGFWRSLLDRERREILAKGTARSPEDAERRSQITYDLKSLRRWRTGREVIAIERAMFGEA
jgi:DNA primase